MSKDGQCGLIRNAAERLIVDLKDVAKIFDLKATDALQLITKLITSDVENASNQDGHKPRSPRTTIGIKSMKKLVSSAENLQ